MSSPHRPAWFSATTPAREDCVLKYMLDSRAARFPERRFARFEDGTQWTYASCRDEVRRLAQGLQASGVRKGDRVFVWLPSGRPIVLAWFAINYLGAIYVPLNTAYKGKVLEHVINAAGGSVMLAHPSLTERLQGLQTPKLQQVFTHIDALLGDESSLDDSSPIEHWDIQCIHYTSGTTGPSKGVLSPYLQGYTTAVVNYGYLQDGECILINLPMFHVGALTPALGNIFVGTTHVLMRAFDPVKVWEIIDSERINNGLFVPAMLNFMRMVYDPSKYKHEHLRWLMAGAAPVPVSLIMAYAEIGIEVNQVYGLTETCGPACLTSKEDAISKAGSTGKAFFLSEVKVVRPDGTECDDDEAGEVLISGGHMMLGYWNRPEATADALKDGWLYSGDGAIRDKDGFIFIQDRIKDMIISGGENVYPAEIENVIMGLAGIGEVAIIGIPSEKWGESPLAIVVRKDEAVTEAAVLEHCADKLARFKQPVAVRFIDVIPRNPSGKALKKDLRIQFKDVVGP